MAPDLATAIEELFRRASTYGSFDAECALGRMLDPERASGMSANDVDSALVRWADALGLTEIPSEVEEAAEQVVTALDSTTDGAGARV